MDTIVNALFPKPPTVEEMVRKWRRELGREIRALDRNIRAIDREEAKAKLEIKKAAKRQDMTTAKTLAKAIVQSRKHKTRLYNSKAHLNSISLHLQQNLTTYKLAGVLQKSTEVMKAMNSLMKLSQLNQTMTAMAREMEKAGLIEEMVDEALDDEEDIDEDVEEEVNKVIDELCVDIMTNAPQATQKIPQKTVATVAPDEQHADAELEKRLNTLQEK
jgi:charged multivesicular body protein 3